MDEARAKMIDDFYEIYRPLQKRYNLRMNSHFSIYERDEDYIEIYEYDGEMRGRRICFVKEDEEIDCYRKAMEALKSYKGKERL